MMLWLVCGATGRSPHCSHIADLLELCNAAGFGAVGLHDVDGTRCHEIAEGVLGVVVLTRRDRNPRCAAKIRVGIQVVWRKVLLEPHQRMSSQ